MALASASVSRFKALSGAEKFDIVKNPHTNKLFASGDNGSVYRVEQAINLSEPIVVLMEDGDLSSACFINERPNNNTLATL